MMKQTCKRLTALLLALSMCLSLLCSNAWAADMTETHGDAVEAVAANETDPGIEEVTPELDEEFAAAGICGVHLTWTLDDAGTLTISGTGAMTNWSWGDFAPWYDYIAQIKAVTIGSGVTSISSYAFYSCENLTGVSISNSVTSIGMSSFFGCSSLTGVTIPSSVTSIGVVAFGGCTSLTSVDIPNSVTSIGDEAFAECSSLTDVYYEGTEEQCSKIEIGTDNDPLTSAVIHFKSATPDCGGNHTWDSGEVTKAATCKAAGTKTFTCTVCGETKNETIPKTAHTIVTDKAVAATCTTAGKTEGKHCSVCGTVTVAQTSVPAKGHSYGAWVTTKQPTATTTGTKERTCSACGTKETQVIPVVSHTHSYTSAVTKAATCAATGVRTYTCSCGDSYTETIAKTAHTWDAGKVTKAATATAEGEKTFTCTVCKTTKTETIAKLKANTITAVDVTKNASTKEQSIALNAKASAGTLKYKSDNDKITIKDGKAVVPANFTGKANITITASGNGYATATKTIVLTINKVANTITASNFTKTYSTKAQSFSIGATRKGSGALTYTSDNKSVTVDSAGKVTVKAKFMGKATITIKVAAKGIYKEATKKITVTVNPTKTTLSSVANASGLKMTVKWAKNTVGTGYEIQYSTSKDFSSGNKSTSVTKNTTVSKTIIGLTKGKTYYVRIRTYRTVSSVKYYSGWSASKSVKISK